MELFKKILALVLCLVMCFAVSACGSKKSNDDDDDDSEDESSETASGNPDCQHEWGDEINENKKPCTKESEITHTCNLCGKEEVVKVIPATGHELNYSTNKCVHCGKKAKSSCDHDDCTWVTIEEATCSQSGYENKICEDCKFIQNTNYLPSLGHDYEYHDYKEATCTEDGHYGYDSCYRCDYDEYESSIIPATGHIYMAGTCQTCSGKNADYSLVDKVANNGIEYTVPAIVEIPYVEDDIVSSQNDEIKSNNDKKAFSFTAECDGVSYVWVTGVTDGVRFRLYCYDASNASIGSNTYASNENGFAFVATAGATYKLSVEGYYGTSPFTLNVTKPKPVLDVSSYNKVSGKILFNDHSVSYTYTAAVSGAYCFTFNDMDDSSEIKVNITNSENATLQSRTWLSNTSNYTVATLNAGETYTITVKESVNYTPFNMVINAPSAAIDITNYATVKDSITFVNQVNTYTFVAPTSGKLYFSISGMLDNADLYLELFDAAGQSIDNESYCDNGDSVSADLVAGQTYTITVSYYYSEFSPYTLNVVMGSEKVALSSNNGYNDSFIVDGQEKIYTFTATKEGNHIVAISGMSNSVYTEIEIFNSNGESVDDDYYFQNNEYIIIKDVKVGDIYTIVLAEDSGLVDYTISVECIG